MSNEQVGIHLDFGALSNCEMMEYSFGEICIKCNVCGRFEEMKRPTREEVIKEIEGEK